MDPQSTETDALSFVDKKLNEWNLTEYIQVFKDNKVDEDAFLVMNTNQVAELIPLVGPRSIFLDKRLAYLKQQSLKPPDETPQALDDTLSVTSSLLADAESALLQPADTGSTKRNITDEPAGTGKRLTQLLKKGGQRTQTLLTKIRLTPRDRKTLCGVIVDELLLKKEKVTADDYTGWAKEVAKVFPYELAEAYYEPYQGGPNKRLASGKLWDRYNNEKKYLRSKKFGDTSGSANSTTTSCAPTVDITAALVKLRAISPDDTDAKDLWRLTARYRDKDVSISEYYKQYPILSTSVGSSLIRIDFEITGLLTDQNILITTWADTAKKLIILAKQRGICKDLFIGREHASVETLGFIVLPYLLRTSRIKTNNRKVWRPSQPEVAEAFILQLTSIGDYAARIAERRDKLYKYDLTIQPFVLTIGTTTTYTSVYVVVEGTKYECSSLMAAVDFCFKATWALNAKYQADCEAVWSFIQRFVYKITTDAKSNKKFQCTQVLWSDIQSLPGPEQ